ncbi:cysteine proteinase [Coniophora puteana RWD-64-598 SS2]|uniref:ubiquitinyl hydrolase 1 n=1 Tax=Coniophora puteana (strain RWD-64-598) TaxID=741705 RepID=A0A5M3N8M4_CONPW|nr:cysteine proteinase [Coniophora puteana RWD-64-598 SS2]EIW87195.1 cysteine proteinase [Coniophora puteana RWD-64-598 SS2]
MPSGPPITPPTSSGPPPSSTTGPVEPASFYATGSGHPPPLPSRPKNQNLGSQHTKIASISTPPPTYHDLDHSSFREPQLVEEALIGDDQIPDLIPPDNTSSWAGSYHTRGRTMDRGNATDNTGWSGGGGSGEAWETGPTPWDGSWGGSNTYGASGWGSTVAPVTDIDGRDKDEEENWWDPAVREQHRRPGPGILPPRVAEYLHDPEHSLFSVSITPPDLKPKPAQDTAETSTSNRSAGANPPPSNDDLIYAIPHPNAYYCRRDNGWVLLQWKSSSILPPLAKSFKPENYNPFPDQERRKRTTSCLGEQPFGQMNKTHHFHRYEKAVDAKMLNPPFSRTGWEGITQSASSSASGTPSSGPSATPADEANMDEDPKPEEEGDLLDLYVCCQCSLYCVVSGVIPGVAASKYVDEYSRDRFSNPAVGKNPQESVIAGWETFLTIVENRLWKNEVRPLPVHRKTFQAKIGWSDTVRVMFEAIGFVLKETEGPGDTREMSLNPPTTDIETAEGRRNRARMLRFWVELGAWVADYHKRFSINLKEYKAHSMWIKIESAREMYQTGIGAHPDQLARALPPTSLTYGPIEHSWESLGMTATSYSWELLNFAYMAQCRCDPKNTPIYFSHFYGIVRTMQDRGDIPPQELQNLVMEERGRGRYTDEDCNRAAEALGFGPEGPLRVELDNDVPEEFIADAWRDAVRRAWRDPENCSQLQRDANDAFRIIAEARESAKLRTLWAESSRNIMDPSRAYTVLEVPTDVEDSMLLTVYCMRVEEQPSQSDRWREALNAIAEVRDSARLRQFLETGQDPGDVVMSARPELPRGLNQLGNTCYLNSLLQYFYTIKDLRETIAPLANTDIKTIEEEKFSDDDLKRHRVGGRLVTRREILRSKKFVRYLADLFWQLEYCELASVTPAEELARLALVTSRDEEDDEADRGGTDASNDTDATLVEDGPASVQPPAALSRRDSILGKRSRDEVAMDVDSSNSSKPSTSTSTAEQVESPRRSKFPRLRGEANAGLSAANTAKTATAETQDVEMQTQQAEVPKPPPLPARKSQVASESVMMFGKQHDVSECMDNCLFQIEIALLKFDGMSDQEDKGSVVKRLFFGKIKQRLSALSEADVKAKSASIHEKEDLFSHLPVNVAEHSFDIYDGLSGYFDDVVEYEGKKNRMEVSLVDLPPLLQIQLQRVQFNRETLQAYKSQAYVKFEDMIYMDRYLDTANAEKKAKAKEIQKELNTKRERLRTLTHEKTSYVESLNSSLDFLSKQESLPIPDVDEELISQLNSEQDHLKIEIEELRKQITSLKDDLELVWSDEKQVAYELTSVFIHRGSSPSWGHYFFYSRHLPEKPDVWYKYNDSSVSEVSKNEVFADTTGSTANPYLLVFSRKGSDVIDTVKRTDPMALVIDAAD